LNNSVRQQVNSGLAPRQSDPGMPWRQIRETQPIHLTRLDRLIRR
jgi:hypothetical protein